MSRVAMQFDDARQQQLAATLGMWAFLASEVLFFGGLFGGYVVYRYQYREAFAIGSSHLSVVSGTVMTAVLLTSSLTIALADHAIKQGDRLKTVWLLAITVVLGLGFLTLKFHEYYQSYHEHLFPGANFELAKFRDTMLGGGPVELFFCFYFFMTGLHAIHMIAGVCVISTLGVLAARQHYGPRDFIPIEIGGLYWHFVDIIWVFLYPLLYLVGG